MPRITKFKQKELLISIKKDQVLGAEIAELGKTLSRVTLI